MTTVTSVCAEWEALEQYREEFDHSLWQKLENLAKGSGHGGMDFLEIYRLIEALRTGTPTDMDVYDAAGGKEKNEGVSERLGTAAI